MRRSQTRWRDALTTCEESLALCRDHGFVDYFADLLRVLALAQYWLGDAQESLATLDESRSEYRLRGDVRGVVRVEDIAIEVQLHLDRPEEAVRIAERCVRLCGSLDEPLARVRARQRLGQALLRAGDITGAIHELQHAHEAFCDAGRPADAAECAILLAAAHDAEGDLPTAVDLLRAAADVLDAAGPVRDPARRHALATLGKLLERLGEDRDVVEVQRRLLDPVIAGRESGSMCEHGAALLRCIAALIRLGETAAAELMVDRAATLGAACDHRSCAFLLASARCWVSWHTEHRPDAVDAALDLIGHPGIGAVGTPQAWVLEIAGTVTGPDQPGGVEYLARALAIYQRMEVPDRARAVADVLIQRTARLQQPAQGWLPIGSGELRPD